VGPVRKVGPMTRYELALPRWYATWTFPHDRRTGKPKVVLGRNGKYRAVKHRRVWDVLLLNARPGSYHQRAAAVREVINATVAAAQAAGLADVDDAEHLTVRLVWAADHNTRTEAHNLHGLVKPIVDALARGRKDLPGLRIVADDTDYQVTTLPPYIRRPQDGGNDPGSEYDGREGLFVEVLVRHRRTSPQIASPVTGSPGHQDAGPDPLAALLGRRITPLRASATPSGVHG
jgi:hypothetical protein